MKVITVYLSLLLAGQCVYGQASKMPTKADIDAVRQAQPNLSESLGNNLDGKSKSIEFPSANEVMNIRKKQANGGLDFSKIQSSSTTNKTDINIFLKELAQAKNQVGDKSSAVPALLIFISFSMPRASLEKIFEQSEKAGALIVLRGLHKESFTDTVNQLSELIGKKKIALHIDPRLFDRFDIKTVPTFTLMKPGFWEGATSKSCEGSCIPTEQFTKITGDMTIDYALETISRLSTDFQNDAGFYLKRIKPQL